MGILPSQYIIKLILEKIISADSKIETSQIQPASLDLRLGNIAWRIRASFLTGKDKDVSNLLDEFKMHQIDMMEGAVLEKGCVYLIPIEENLKLPSDLSAVANAKSSTGRLDLLTRIITNKGIEFDKIKTTNVNILLNRVRLDQKRALKKRIVFSIILAGLVSSLAIYFII